MKSVLKTILFLACFINAEPALHFGGFKCDISSEPSLQKEIQAIDDSLYARWSKGEFIIPEIADLCGCFCVINDEHCCYDDAISITSAHDVGDKFWLFDYCGVMDSIVSISDALDITNSYTRLEKNSVLWKMVKDFKKHAHKIQKDCLKLRKKK
jgi:hypothetical protein